MRYVVEEGILRSFISLTGVCESSKNNFDALTVREKIFLVNIYALVMTLTSINFCSKTLRNILNITYRNSISKPYESSAHGNSFSFIHHIYRMQFHLFPISYFTWVLLKISSPVSYSSSSYNKEWWISWERLRWDGEGSCASFSFVIYILK